MIARLIPDAQHFLKTTLSFLREQEAMNNLLVGLAHAVVDGKEKADLYRWFSVSEGEILRMAAFCNNRSLVLSHGPKEAIEPLVQLLRTERIDPPGVNGPAALSDCMRDLWCAERNCTHRLLMDQRVYRLTQVASIPSVPGSARAATLGDLATGAKFFREFIQEVLPHETWGEDVQNNIRMRIETQQLYFWETDGKVVCMVSLTRPSENGIVIGPVYTPLEERGKGYGTALTAYVSAEGLRRGKKFCSLYTDLTNPTSNSIYQKIGYRPVGDARNWKFNYPSVN